MNLRTPFRFSTAPKPLEAQTTLLTPIEKAVVDSGLEPYQGPWGVPEVSHLLRRLMFGAKWEDVQFFQSLGLAETVGHLLSNNVPPPPEPVNDYNSEDFTDPDVPFGEPWAGAPYNSEAEGVRIWSLKGWWVGNIIEQGRSIGEKMIVFWHNHLPVAFYGVSFGQWDYIYLNTLREHATGNFRSLVRAITIDPAMLHYLSGQYNAAGAPDENYARELQELFCIGKGPNSTYTESDVQAAARILTGWRVNDETGLANFEPWAHDTSDKQFSAFYDNAMIPGRQGQEGAEELDELLDMIFANNECALFLCRKIYRFFVYHEIDDLTEENIIQPLADIFRSNDYEIRPVLETLFNSQHFFDFLTLGAVIKSPVDFLGALYREFNTPIPPRSMLAGRYEHNTTVVWALGYLFGQNLGDPPNVAGWPAYHQLPAYDKSWINTNTLPARAKFTDWILWSGLSTGDFTSQLNILETVAQLPNPSDPNALIDTILAWLYGIEAPAAFRLQLKAILLSGQISDHYWTDAWLSYAADPSDTMAAEVVRSRLMNFFYTLIHQSEYQLC